MINFDGYYKGEGKYKEDFNHVTLKRVKLPLVPPSEKFVVIKES